MFTVSLALFMDVLDSNIINTAVPAMARSLQVNPVDLKNRFNRLFIKHGYIYSYQWMGSR